MADRTYIGGFTHTVLHEEADGTIHIEEKQDCGAILDHNAAMRNERFHGGGPGEFTEFANVPMTVYLAKCREIGQTLYAEPDIAMELILRDPQYAKFIAAPTVRDPHVIVKGKR